MRDSKARQEILHNPGLIDHEFDVSSRSFGGVREKIVTLVAIALLDISVLPGDVRYKDLTEGKIVDAAVTRHGHEKLKGMSAYNPLFNACFKIEPFTQNDTRIIHINGISQTPTKAVVGDINGDVVLDGYIELFTRSSDADKKVIITAELTLDNILNNKHIRISTQNGALVLDYNGNIGPDELELIRHFNNELAYDPNHNHLSLFANARKLPVHQVATTLDAVLGTILKPIYNVR